MADRRINVELGFTADTSAAKRQIAELQSQLQNIAKMPGTGDLAILDDATIKNASSAALELQKHLSAAVNVNTGKLDLSRLSTSLKASNKDLSSYYDSLIKLGPVGEQAFMSIAQAVATADAPVARLNSKMQDFVDTLAKTAKWQISGDVFRGLTSTISSAYSYAQDLNKSLNDIRIVTGESADQMTAFAKQANKAAQELSATTLAYTDASLIFFQQGN